MIMSDSTLYNRLKELTIVDFERDSAETESKHSSLRSLLTQFMECEGRSCSFDLELVTPEYVYRMWGIVLDDNLELRTIIWGDMRIIAETVERLFVGE